MKSPVSYNLHTCMPHCIIRQWKDDFEFIDFVALHINSTLFVSPIVVNSCKSFVLWLLLVYMNLNIFIGYWSCTTVYYWWHCTYRCTPNPCEHDGVCDQDWNTFRCDCQDSGYTGEVCHRCKLFQHCPK